MSIALFLFNLILFSVNQSAYSFGGDSAEYLTVAKTWSLAHPPGYPLYSLLSNLLTHAFPRLSEIYVTNLLSFVPTALTTAILYRVIQILTKDKWISFCSALIYGFLFPVWLYAEVPEVFALNALIVTVITYLILLYNQKPKDIYRYAVFFLLGLSVTHHHTFLLFIPGWYILLKQSKTDFLMQNLAKNLFFLLIGLSFYLYAPIVSRFNPPLGYENAQTPEGFIRLITRASYGTFKAYSSSVPSIVNQLAGIGSFFLYILADFRIIGILLIAAGSFYLLKKNKRFFKFCALTMLIQVIFIFYANFPVGTFSAAISERFLLNIYLLLIFLFPFGLLYTKTLVSNIGSKFLFVFNLFLIGLTAIFFFTNYRQIVPLKKIAVFDNYAKDIMNTVSKKGILSTATDNGTFLSEYYYYVKKFRPDIYFVHQSLLERQFYQDKIKAQYRDLILAATAEEFISKNYSKHEFFAEAPVTQGAWTPVGLLYKYYPTQQLAEKDLDNIIKTNIALWNKYNIPVIDNSNNQFIHIKSVQEAYLRGLVTFSQLLFNYNKDELAVNYLKKIVTKYDRKQVEANRLLMVYYAKRRECSAAKEYKTNFSQKLNQSANNHIASLLNFYYYCDNNNQDVNKYMQLYEKIRQKDRSPLNKL